MTGFRVGVMDPIIAARPTAESFTRANYLSALANRVDSFWVPDHLNALFPRSLWQPKYCGATKVVPSADAYMEPWTMLGHVAAPQQDRTHAPRRGRDRYRSTEPGGDRTGRRDAASADPRTGDFGHRPRRTGRQRTLRGGLVKPVARFEEAMATIRALWDSGGQLVNRDSPYFPLRNAIFDLPPYRGKWPEIWIAAHGPACCEPRGATEMAISPASRTDQRTTRNV